jgi:hypothetical protein
MYDFNSDPWHVDEELFPYDGAATEQLRFLLSYAVLAPSGHNSQPWLFRLAADTVDLIADRTRALPVVDPHDRELIISCGAALFNLRIALRRFGRAGRIAEFPDVSDPDLLARVSLGAPHSATGDDHLLFSSITARRTNRMPFDRDDISDAALFELAAAAADEQAWFCVLRDETSRTALADLVGEADRIQGADPRFRRELAAWIHPNRTRSRDGIPGSALGFGEAFSYVGPLIIRTFDCGGGQAARDRQLALGSPVLAVLGTVEDTMASWLAAGQALANVLLRAHTLTLSASFLNQPIETFDLRPRVQSLLNRPGFSQVILRLGHGPAVKPTPRRPVSEVVLAAPQLEHSLPLAR